MYGKGIPLSITVVSPYHTHRRHWPSVLYAPPVWKLFLPHLTGPSSLPLFAFLTSLFRIRNPLTTLIRVVRTLPTTLIRVHLPIIKVRWLHLPVPSSNRHLTSALSLFPIMTTSPARPTRLSLISTNSYCNLNLLLPRGARSRLLPLPMLHGTTNMLPLPSALFLPMNMR